jgi:hypothetical protein
LVFEVVLLHHLYAELLEFITGELGIAIELVVSLQGTAALTMAKCHDFLYVIERPPIRRCVNAGKDEAQDRSGAAR